MPFFHVDFNPEKLTAAPLTPDHQEKDYWDRKKSGTEKT